MPNPEDVIPGELIEAVWGNQVRDQSVQPFPDATARDVSIPLPDEGLLVYLSDPGTIQVYDGAQWIDLETLLEVLPLEGGTMTGPIVFAGNGTIRGASSGIGIDSDGIGEVGLFGANVFRLSGNQGTAWMPHGLGAGPSETNPAYSFAGDTTTGMYRSGTNQIGLATQGTNRFNVASSQVAINPLPLGRPADEWEWRYTRGAEGLRGFTNNTAGTSILEYLRINKSGTTARVSYRGSAATSTAVANATWFTSNEITTGSRSLGQSALAQGDHVEPGASSLDVTTDAAVAAVRSVPVRRGRYQSGYLIPGDPREGVDHPMILADELEALNPELVDRLPVFDDDGVQGPDDLVVNQSVLNAVLVAAIQDLSTRVAALESSQ